MVSYPIILDHLLRNTGTSYIYSILGIEVIAFLLSRLCTSLRIRLLCNRASVSLVLCNKSIFVDSTFWLILDWTTPLISLRVCFCVPYFAIGLLVALQTCESFPTLLKLTNNCIKFYAIILTKLHHKILLV